jgi:hypothetical protein
MPEVEVEVEKDQQKKTSSSSSAPAPPPRDDVDQLVERLRSRVAANGFKIPRTFADWRRQARLLIDSDGRDLTQALRLVDWATSHHFWMGNIRSMGKFREQYDALIVQARNEYRQQQAPTRGSRTDEWQALKQQPIPEGRANLRSIAGGEAC